MAKKKKINKYADGGNIPLYDVLKSSGMIDMAEEEFASLPETEYKRLASEYEKQRGAINPKDAPLNAQTISSRTFSLPEAPSMIDIGINPGSGYGMKFEKSLTSINQPKTSGEYISNEDFHAAEKIAKDKLTSGSINQLALNNIMKSLYGDSGAKTQHAMLNMMMNKRMGGAINPDIFRLGGMLGIPQYEDGGFLEQAYQAALQEGKIPADTSFEAFSQAAGMSQTIAQQTNPLSNNTMDVTPKEDQKLGERFGNMESGQMEAASAKQLGAVGSGMQGISGVIPALVPSKELDPNVTYTQDSNKKKEADNLSKWSTGLNTAAGAANAIPVYGQLIGGVLGLAGGITGAVGKTKENASYQAVNPQNQNPFGSYQFKLGGKVYGATGDKIVHYDAPTHEQGGQLIDSNLTPTSKESNAAGNVEKEEVGVTINGKSYIFSDTLKHK